MSGRVMYQGGSQTGCDVGNANAATGNDNFNRKPDRLWISDYTPESPSHCPTAGTAGSKICQYTPWKSFTDTMNKMPNMTAKICIDLPNWQNVTDPVTKQPLSTWANCTHSMAVAGNCVFAGMLADPMSPGGGLINVYNATNGDHLGALDPNRDQPRVGGDGWTDIICTFVLLSSIHHCFAAYFCRVNGLSCLLAPRVLLAFH